MVLIPQGTFLILPVMLQGPCNGSIQLQIDGQVLAPRDQAFAKADHLLVSWRDVKGNQEKIEGRIFGDFEWCKHIVEIDFTETCRKRQVGGAQRQPNWCCVVVRGCISLTNATFVVYCNVSLGVYRMCLFDRYNTINDKKKMSYNLAKKIFGCSLVCT